MWAKNQPHRHGAFPKPRRRTHRLCSFLKEAPMCLSPDPTEPGPPCRPWSFMSVWRLSCAQVTGMRSRTFHGRPGLPYIFWLWMFSWAPWFKYFYKMSCLYMPHVQLTKYHRLRCVGLNLRSWFSHSLALEVQDGIVSKLVPLEASLPDSQTCPPVCVSVPIPASCKDMCQTALEPVRSFYLNRLFKEPRPSGGAGS